MNLYSPPTGGHPQELPDRWKFADGTVRTDLKSLSNADLLSLGWVGPITQSQPFTKQLDENGDPILDEDGNPVIEGDYNPETHKTVWYRAARKYVVVENHIDEAPYDSGKLVSNVGGIADWNTFKQSAVASTKLNTFVAELMSVAPVAATALPATLLLLESGTYSDFENTWTAIENATTVPAALITEMTALAESCNLPEEFVSIFAA
jgi:hypothetical protein